MQIIIFIFIVVMVVIIVIVVIVFIFIVIVVISFVVTIVFFQQSQVFKVELNFPTMGYSGVDQR